MTIEFRDGRVDAGDGGELELAMAAEIRVMYEGLELDGSAMPAAGPAELNPPGGRFVVGYEDGRPVCCGGIKRLAEGICEFKRMYVVPEARGRGFARALLVELEQRARGIGYSVARLDTGPRQPASRHIFESAGYLPIGNFNNNPVAIFWGEKRLA